MTTQPKKYTETLISELYKKDTYKESSNGNEYPDTRIKVEHLSYDGEVLTNDNVIKPYSGEKIKITVSKLTMQDGDVAVKHKAFTSRDGSLYTKPDESFIKVTPEQFQDMLDTLDK